MKRFSRLTRLGMFLAVFVAVAQAGICRAEGTKDLVATTPTTPQALGEVSPTPECFRVINQAPYTVYGSINTNYFIRDDGIKARHRSNFRLEKENVAEFCTFGPFYDGHKVELVLRTLVPIFSCKTGVNGDITIYGRKKAEGGTDTFAACLD